MPHQPPTIGRPPLVAPGCAHCASVGSRGVRAKSFGCVRVRPAAVASSARMPLDGWSSLSVGGVGELGFNQKDGGMDSGIPQWDEEKIPPVAADWGVSLSKDRSLWKKAIYMTAALKRKHKVFPDIQWHPVPFTPQAPWLLECLPWRENPVKKPFQTDGIDRFQVIWWLLVVYFSRHISKFFFQSRIPIPYHML